MKACQTFLFAIFLLFCQTAFAQEAVNSSLTIRIGGGNYVISGTVSDDFVKNQVIEKIKASLGANADFSRLNVEASAEAFQPDWQSQLDAALPKIKSWKSGVFIFSNQKRQPFPNYPPLPAEIADARFLLTDGRTVSTKDFPNKVVVLFLFATWCGPCLEQADVLSRIYSKTNSPNLEIIALDIENTPQYQADLRTFLARRDFKYKFGWTNETVVQSFFKVSRLQGIPQVLLTVNGNLRGVFSGGGKKVNRKLEDTVLKALGENNL